MSESKSGLATSSAKTEALTPRFRVGDVVRIVATKFADTYGHEGPVTRVDVAPSGVLRTWVNLGALDERWYHEKDLSPIEPPAATDSKSNGPFPISPPTADVWCKPPGAHQTLTFDEKPRELGGIWCPEHGAEVGVLRCTKCKSSAHKPAPPNRPLLHEECIAACEDAAELKAEIAKVREQRDAERQRANRLGDLCQGKDDIIRDLKLRVAELDFERTFKRRIGR